jgi:hypothetical protein
MYLDSFTLMNTDFGPFNSPSLEAMNNREDYGEEKAKSTNS